MSAMKLSPEQQAALRSMRQIYRMVCPGSGFSAELMTAIFAHETNGGISVVWKKATNPGGIKFRGSFFITSCFPVYQSTVRSVRYASYPNSWVAAVAHVLFLRQVRYATARDKGLKDAVEQLARAGYIGPGPGEPANWINGVLRWEEAIREL